MSSNRYVARSTAIASRALGNETMVMSAVDSTLFTLNEVASIIWQSADGVTLLEKIVTERICPEYDVRPDVALKDADLLVEGLARCGLMTISDKPIQGDNSTTESSCPA
jgi:hypothetical protein